MNFPKLKKGSETISRVKERVDYKQLKKSIATDKNICEENNVYKVRL